MNAREAMNFEKFKDRVVKYFWIALTLSLAIFTIVVSVRTVGDIGRTQQRRRDIEPKIAQLEENIARDSSFIYNLQRSPDFLEEFARERFRMQRDADVVYILEE